MLGLELLLQEAKGVMQVVLFVVHGALWNFFVVLLVYDILEAGGRQVRVGRELAGQGEQIRVRSVFRLRFRGGERVFGLLVMQSIG